jgi:hypothetical protein
MLATGLGVRAEAAASGWFPFKLLTLNDLPQPAVEAEQQ